MSLSAGTRLGRYEIVAAVGAGGMGEVYRARDTGLDREVAIKVLSPGLTSSDLARDTLEERLRKGPLDLPMLLETAIALADSLAATHAAGISTRTGSTRLRRRGPITTRGLILSMRR